MKTVLLSLLLLFQVVVAEAQAPLPNVPPKGTKAIQVWWDASPTPGVSYVLRRGVASGRYDDMVLLPPGTLTYVWTNAPSTATNFFVVTAKLSGMNNGVPFEEESPYSNEVAAAPRVPVEAPNLRSAVPITVSIFRGQPGQMWAKVIDVGPFYDEALKTNELYEARVKIGAAVKLLPE